MARNRQTQSRRYYYQNCLKDPIKVNGVTKLIELPYPDFQSIPIGQRWYVGQLIEKWGYNVQYKLLSVEPKEMPVAEKTEMPVKNKIIKKQATGQLKLL